jgi:hypothetical protein
MSTLGWPRHPCHVDADTTRAKGAATCDEGAGCESMHIV